MRITKRKFLVNAIKIEMKRIIEKKKNKARSYTYRMKWIQEMYRQSKVKYQTYHISKL